MSGSDSSWLSNVFSCESLHRVLGAVVDLAERGRQVRPLELAEGVGHQHRLHELLGHADVEERARLLALAQLDDAALLVEVDVGEGADRDREGGVLAPLGGRDDDVGHADRASSRPRSAFFGFRAMAASYAFLRFGAALGAVAARRGRGRLRGRCARGRRPWRAGRPVAGARACACRAAVRRRFLGRRGSWPSAAPPRPARRRAAPAPRPRRPRRVTMIECGSPSGPLVLAQDLVGLVAAGALHGHLLELLLQLLLRSRPPFSRLHASTTSSM